MSGAGLRGRLVEPEAVTPAARSSRLSTALSRPLPLRVFLGLVALFVAGLTIVTVALPHNHYIRFQALRGTLHERASWIYERIHDDPAPIDVVFIGPSRMAAAVDTPMLSRDLSQSLGMPIHAVNFAFAQAGHDLDYLILREVLNTKRVKLAVLAVIEQQPRGGHPAFKELANTSDILGAPLLLNRDYLRNLAYLPMRQLRLAWASLFPSAEGYRATFDPAAYEGSDVNTRKRFSHRPQDANADPPTQEGLEADSRRYATSITRPVLPTVLTGLEFTVPRTSYVRMKELADQHGVRLILLYLPFYKGPAQPTDAAFYRTIGPILVPAAALVGDYQNFEDVAHLNEGGAAKLTAWLAGQLLPYLREGR